MQRALVFIVQACGFTARSARERKGTEDRLSKIIEIIKQSQFGIHDISRTDLDPDTKLPRFNMSFELGLFIAAREVGSARQKRKAVLILDDEPYKYRKSLSDLAGMDPVSHDGKVEGVITAVRDWLSDFVKNERLPGGSWLSDLYARWETERRVFFQKIEIRLDEATFNDYACICGEWLELNPALR